MVLKIFNSYKANLICKWIICEYVNGCSVSAGRILILARPNSIIHVINDKTMFKKITYSRERLNIVYCKLKS